MHQQAREATPTEPATSPPATTVQAVAQALPADAAQAQQPVQQTTPGQWMQWGIWQCHFKEMP